MSETAKKVDPVIAESIRVRAKAVSQPLTARENLQLGLSGGMFRSGYTTLAVDRVIIYYKTESLCRSHFWLMPDDTLKPFSNNR